MKINFICDKSQNIQFHINAQVFNNSNIAFTFTSNFIENSMSASRQLITEPASKVIPDEQTFPTSIWTNLPIHRHIFLVRTLMFPSRTYYLISRLLFRVKFCVCELSLFCKHYECVWVHLQTRALIWFTLCVAHRQTSLSAPSRNAKSRASWCWSATLPPTLQMLTSCGRSKTKTRPSRRTWRPRASSAFSHSSQGAKISAPTSVSPTTRLACPSRANETSQVSLN